MPYKAGMAPVPKDDPDRVHTHALVREAIDFSHGVFNFQWGMISSSTHIKLSNGNGDRQKPCGPSFVKVDASSVPPAHPCIVMRLRPG